MKLGYAWALYLPSQVYPSAFNLKPVLQKQYSDPSALTPHCWEQLKVVLVHTVLAKEKKCK